MKNIAIVTGASSGIGKNLAISIAKNFDIDEIWLIARRKDRLMELGKKIYKNYKVNVVVIAANLIEEKSIQKIEDRLKKYKVNISILVNSSGFGVMGASSDIDRKTQEDMILLNCKALFTLTNICTPYMSKGSGIIQISSVAAFCPQPYFSIYSATKSFVLSYSISLAHELKGKGIKVSVLCPGPVNTEFFNICEKDAKMENTIKKLFMKDVNFIVKETIKGYKKGKKIIVPSVFMKLIGLIQCVHMQVITSALAYKIYKKYN